MNVRAAPAATTAKVIRLPLARRRLAEAAIVPIAPDVAAIMFDSPPDGGRPRPRLTALFAGQPLRGPSISTSLELRSGGRRHVLVVGRGAESLTGMAVTLALGAQLAAILDGDWLQPPIADGAALVRGLAEAGRRRLLKLFMTTGASLFGRGSAEFAQAARRLAEMVAAAALVPVSWCPLGVTGRVVSYRLPTGVVEAEIEELIAVGTEPPGAARRLGDAGRGRRGAAHPASLPAERDRRPGPGWSGLVPRSCICGRRTRSFCRSRWRPGSRGGGPRWRPGSPGWWRSSAEADPVAAALARELRQAAEAAPRAVVRHLSATRGGVLFAVDLADSDGLVRALRIERGGEAEEAHGRGADSRASQRFRAMAPSVGCLWCSGPGGSWRFARACRRRSRARRRRRWRRSRMRWRGRGWSCRGWRREGGEISGRPPSRRCRWSRRWRRTST